MSASVSEGMFEIVCDAPRTMNMGMFIWTSECTRIMFRNEVIGRCVYVSISLYVCPVM